VSDGPANYILSFKLWSFWQVTFIVRHQRYRHAILQKLSSEKIANLQRHGSIIFGLKHTKCGFFSRFFVSPYLPHYFIIQCISSNYILWERKRKEICKWISFEASDSLYVLELCGQFCKLLLSSPSKRVSQHQPGGDEWGNLSWLMTFSNLIL